LYDLGGIDLTSARIGEG